MFIQEKVTLDTWLASSFWEDIQETYPSAHICPDPTSESGGGYKGIDSRAQYGM